MFKNSLFIFCILLKTATLFGAELKQTIKHRIQEIEDIAQTLQKESSRNQIHKQLNKYLINTQEFYGFNLGSYPELHSKLLLAATKALKQEEQIPLQNYPKTEKRDYIHFIYDQEQPNQLLGVFKSEQPRLKEILTWEIASLFGIEDVFTPALPLTLNGITGEFQLFQRNDLSSDQYYSKKMYGHITFDSYIKCALGVLLMALEDMHNDNCYYHLCREGYVKMGMFDTLRGFSHTSFTCDESVPNYPVLRSPFAWIGWDFPQRSRPITKKFERSLTKLMKTWSKRSLAFQSYIHHPDTPQILTRDEVTNLCLRAQTLALLVLSRPKAPIQTWHEAILPAYPDVQQRLKRFYPSKDTAWILFRLQWAPQKAYDWMPVERHSEFREWVREG